jgi:hypothetical protein
MRSLHRDIGFFLIGLTIIYSLSGILLIYRDTGFLKKERQITLTVEPNMEPEDLGKTLQMRNFEIVGTDGNLVFFNTGTYNRETGEVVYSSRDLPQWLTKIIGLHKSSTRSPLHWVGVIYGSLLLFMAVSSLWMFKTGTGLFRRGITLAAGGAATVLIILLL